MKSKATRITSEGSARIKETAAMPGGQAPRASDDQVRAWIAEAAYYRAEKRGFSPGLEDEDWVAAEAEVLARTRGGRNIV